MAITPNSNVLPQSIVNAAVQIANSDATNKKTIRTGSTNGDKIESISITSTDTVAQALNVYMNVGGTDYQIGTVLVPIAAGTDAGVTASVSLLESNAMLPWVRYDSNGRGYLYLAANNILKFAAQVTLTSAKVIDIVAQIGAF